jgi:hypothetical protein
MEPKRQAVVRDRQPGDKHANGQSHPRTRYQTGSAYSHDSIVEQAGVRNSHFFGEAKDQKDNQGLKFAGIRDPKRMLDSTPVHSQIVNSSIGAH